MNFRHLLFLLQEGLRRLCQSGLSPDFVRKCPSVPFFVTTRAIVNTNKSRFLRLERNLEVAVFESTTVRANSAQRARYERTIWKTCNSVSIQQNQTSCILHASYHCARPTCVGKGSADDSHVCRVPVSSKMQSRCVALFTYTLYGRSVKPCLCMAAHSSLRSRHCSDTERETIGASRVSGGPRAADLLPRSKAGDIVCKRISLAVKYVCTVSQQQIGCRIKRRGHCL